MACSSKYITVLSVHEVQQSEIKFAFDVSASKSDAGSDLSKLVIIYMYSY